MLYVQIRPPVVTHLTVGLLVRIVDVPYHFGASGGHLLADVKVLIDRIAIQDVQRHGRATFEFREHCGGRHRTQPASQSARFLGGVRLW